MMNEKKVLVTGIGGQTGQAVAKFLTDKGFRVVGTDVRSGVVHSRSRTVQVYHCYHPDYISQLLTLCKMNRVSLLIPTIPAELVRIAEYQNVFQDEGIEVFVSSRYACWICADKFVTAICLRSYNLPVPKSAISPVPLATEKLVESCGLPLVAKPRKKRTGQRAKVYLSLADLQKETWENLVFQEFIPGREYSANLFVDPHWPNEILANQVLLKKPNATLLSGRENQIRSAIAPDVARLAAQAAVALGLTGPLEMDIRRRQNGEPVILKIRACLGPHVLRATRALDALLKTWQMGRKIKPEKKSSEILFHYN